MTMALPPDLRRVALSDTASPAPAEPDEAQLAAALNDALMRGDGDQASARASNLDQQAAAVRWAATNAQVCARWCKDFRTRQTLHRI